jgi:Ras GTPase-activating-like protein IQGAP2/3
MMTTYTRRSPGQSYLKHVLADRINKILHETTLDLEINPSKVYEKLIQDLSNNGTTNLPSDMSPSVTAEEALANPHVQAIIAPRVQTLIAITTEFLDTIIKNIDIVPYGIRWICKQIKILTKVSLLLTTNLSPLLLRENTLKLETSTSAHLSVASSFYASLILQSLLPKHT